MANKRIDCQGGVTAAIDTVSTSVLNSMTAFTSLIQAIISGVVQVNGSDVRATLSEQERMLEEFSVYAPPFKA